MPVDIYAATSNDGLSLQELELYHQLMAYRVENELGTIPLSTSLTITAGRHAADTYYNIWVENVTLPEGASLHSWSDAYYYSDHRDPAVMWDAPERLGTGYTASGYEISAAGQNSTATALSGWQGSSGHDAVILNTGIWASQNWSSIGIGIEYHNSGDPYGGRIYHVWFGASPDPAGVPEISGTGFNDTILGTAYGDVIRALDGSDQITGGGGNDRLFGGASESDLRDVIYGGEGDDEIDGGYGNDELRGDGGNDTIVGGFGVDDIFGGDGDDELTGQAWSDLIFGGAGDDFINGGFGFDRVNGGDGADRFFHIGDIGHGSDWIQDYDEEAGDVLMFGGAATRDQFQVNFTETTAAGAAGVEEAFVIFRPTGQILWALIDGAAQDEINLLLNGSVFDLMA